MKRFFILIAILVLATSATAHAKAAKSAGGGASGPAAQWINAMMNGGAGINSIITPDFEYTSYGFDFKNRLYRGKKGDIPFFAKKSKPVEINVVETRSAPGGQLVILETNADEGLYRTWETRLLVSGGGISKVTEIAKEGKLTGFPPGCPETTYKRDLAVSLHGFKEIELYRFSRDTCTLDFLPSGVDEKMFKYCNPRPDTFLIESEVVVLNDDGGIENASTLAAEHKEEGKDKPNGAKFISENGTNFPGRLFDLGNGDQGLLATFTSETGDGENIKKVDRAILYKWSNGWKPFWGFDVGYGQAAGFLASFANQVEWSLRSTKMSDGSRMVARLESNDNSGMDCPIGTTINFTVKGTSVKKDSKGVPSGCFKKWWGGDSLLKSNLKEDSAPKYNKPVEEIDWRFQ